MCLYDGWFRDGPLTKQTAQQIWRDLLLNLQVCQRPNYFRCRDLLRWTLFRRSGSKLPHDSWTGSIQVYWCIAFFSRHSNPTALLLIHCSKPKYTMINSQDALLKGVRVLVSRAEHAQLKWSICLLALGYKALNDPAYRTNLPSRYNPTRSLRN